MYLKAIEIHGFKSFADKIYIEFDRGITSVVGPNGSGKSNILDAVLWVLGEQSYKTIRAKESQDVIFSGGKDKKAMNSAEVSLYIDNSDQFLPAEDEEIKITRKIHITGENEYYINDNKRRLKDIGRIFLDTGIGKNAYSIIGQGKVERIINSSVKEIKNIIEEAAGIKKFQMQQDESLKNLKNVESELEKLAILINEISTNKNQVESQAKQAKKYIDLRDKKNSLAKALYLAELNEKLKLIEDGDILKTTLQSDCDINKENLEKIDNRIEKIEETKDFIKKSINDITTKNKGLKAEIEYKEKEEVRINERLLNFEREIQEKKEKNKFLEEKIENQNETLKGIEEEKTTLSQKIDDLKDEHNKFETEIEKYKEKKNDLEASIEAKNKKLLDLKLEKVTIQNEIETSDKRKEQSETKINNSKEELKALEKEINENEIEIQKLKDDFEKKSEKLKEVEERNKFIEKEISTVSINLNKISEKIRKTSYDYERFFAKYESLKRLTESNEGFNKGVKEILNSNLQGVEGVFISLISIPENFEKAIEAGIPGNIQDIVVSDSNVANKAISILKEKNLGRASFLALDTIKPNKRTFNLQQGIYGIAADLVEYDIKYKKAIDFVLGNLLIVENMEIAIKLIKTNSFSGNIVTIAGEMVSSRGRITGGQFQKTTASQIFERKKEITSLKKIIDEQEANLKVDKETQDKMSEQLENYENEYDEIENLEDNTRKDKKLAEESYNDILTKNEKTKKNKGIVEAEIETELKYIDGFEKKIKESTSDNDKINDITTKLISDKEADEVSLKQNSQTLEDKENEFSDIKIVFENSKNRLDQLKANEIKENREKKDLEDEFTKLNNRLSSINEEKTELIESQEDLNKKIKESLLNYKEDDKEIQDLKEREENLSKEDKLLSKEKTKTESNLLQANDKLERIKESLERAKSDIEDLELQISDLTDILPEEIDISKLKYLKDKLRGLESGLINFGDVNLLAIEEFEKLEKKYNYFSSQRDDLVKGKKVLMDLITELKGTIKARFYETFEAIDKNFNQMCMETLDNSEGKLNLIESDSFESSGVEISVKFRNKKRQSLSLLSGGEKSMVAIAFIMSIFMYKPSPFTFLDEIEAALDEKNTRKLISKLKQFTDKSQFILITHNKDTMRESDSIFGVTMNKEIGVSKIVPVKF